VLAGEVDAGVIIHESQLTYADEGLVKVVDFGELWRDRENLPVPLGLDVVRRDLGPDLMRAVAEGFAASIRHALDHEDDALRYALQFGRGLDLEQGRRFVRMYVNDLTLELGVTAGVLASAPTVEIV
jgi:1,4-dihydroxy-6-naphthoate synthase